MSGSPLWVAFNDDILLEANEWLWLVIMVGFFGLNLRSHGCDHALIALMLVAIVAYQSMRGRGDLDRLRGWPLQLALTMLLVHGTDYDMHHFEMT